MFENDYLLHAAAAVIDYQVHITIYLTLMRKAHTASVVLHYRMRRNMITSSTHSQCAVCTHGFQRFAQALHSQSPGLGSGHRKRQISHRQRLAAAGVDVIHCESHNRIKRLRKWEVTVIGVVASITGREVAMRQRESDYMGAPNSHHVPPTKRKEEQSRRNVLVPSVRYRLDPRQPTATAPHGTWEVRRRGAADIGHNRRCSRRDYLLTPPYERVAPALSGVVI